MLSVLSVKSYVVYLTSIGLKAFECLMRRKLSNDLHKKENANDNAR